jgi:hypothetical protein
VEHGRSRVRAAHLAGHLLVFKERPMPTALLARVGRAHVYTRTALTVLLSTGLAPAIPAAAQDQTRETVIEWNRVLNQAFATPGANPGTVFFTPRMPW